MPAEQGAESAEPQSPLRRRYEQTRRRYFKTLISPEIVEEHRRRPLGPHSRELARLLLYLRRAPDAERYAIIAVEPFRAYRIAAGGLRDGGARRVPEGEIYGSASEARHGVFLRRVLDLLES